MNDPSLQKSSPIPAVLRTRGLTKRFGSQTAVSKLDLEVRKGDIYGFLGLNGAGKTTTLRMSLGLMRPDEGSIELFGRSDGPGRLAAMSRVGAMVEGPSFYGHLSGAQNLRVLGALSGRLAKGRVAEVLDLVGLGDSGRKQARHYSLGMKQRLGIALALVSSPELVVLDEPTNGLDPSGILEMRHLIQRLNASGTTFVISSHLLYEIEMVCNRIIILERGQLVYEGDTKGFGSRGPTRQRLRAGSPEKVTAFLDTLKLKTETVETGELEFEMEMASVPDLVEKMVRAGIAVTSIHEHRPSLEEFFLRTSERETKGKLS